VGVGCKLANDGVDARTIQAYLGHKLIQHTVRYTKLAPTRFKKPVSRLTPISSKETAAAA
jgi:site-specific recombinase XerD